MIEPADRRRLLQRLVAPLVAIALLVAAWLAWERYPVATPEAEAGRAPPGREVYFGPPNSLAVLPFADRSPAGDQTPQAHGFAGELLQRFVQVPELQVSARSSSFFFRDESAPPRVVAERLQCAILLRGEWLETGGRLTVTATLFDAHRDREIWRSDYAGGLPDIPALRDTIVRDALDALPGLGPRASSRIGARIGLSHTPTASYGVFDPAAWLLVQQGLYQADPLAGADLAAAEASLRAALDLDSTYAAARLSLAELLLHPARPPGASGSAVAEARRLAEQLVAGAVDSAAGPSGDFDRIRARSLGVLSYVRHRYDWDWPGAVDAGRRAVTLQPGDAGLLILTGVALSTLAEFEEARQLLEASVQRDPLNLGGRLRLGLLQEFSGLYEEALASYRQVLALHREYPAARAYRARVKVLQDKSASALRESEQEADPFWRRYARILALTAAERPGEAEPLLEAMIEEDGEVAAFQLAELLAFRNETGRAFEWLQRARQQRDPGLSAVLGNPMLRNLHEDPRWAGQLEQLGLPAGSALDSPP